MSKKIEKLTTMINRAWTDGDTVYRFLGFTEEREHVVIKTDHGPLTTNIYDLNVYLNDFKEVESGVLVLPDKREREEIQSIQKLKDVLMENIEKVKADPSYVPQAKVISNTAQALINLAKLELDYRRKG